MVLQTRRVYRLAELDALYPENVAVLVYTRGCVGVTDCAATGGLAVPLRYVLRLSPDDSHHRQLQPHQARIDALEQRVKTLELIITDKGYDLKREFEKL
ncbi:MAG: hypothetical protein WCE70_10460 [Rhodanobacteraceae bacterium]